MEGSKDGWKVVEGASEGTSEGTADELPVGEGVMVGCVVPDVVVGMEGILVGTMEALRPVKSNPGGI